MDGKRKYQEEQPFGLFSVLPQKLELKHLCPSVVGPWDSRQGDGVGNGTGVQGGWLLVRSALLHVKNKQMYFLSEVVVGRRSSGLLLGRI